MESIRILRESSLVKRLKIRAIGWLSRRVLSVDRVIDLGLRFGPYGSGVNPFNKKGLNLARLKQKPHGVFLGELEPCLPKRLFTRDKKIHLAPQPMLDDLPRLKVHLQKLHTETQDTDTLQIVSRLTNRTLGWMHHSQRLVKGRNPVELIIHPLDAEARGIKSESIVRLSTKRGDIDVPVHISDDIMPGVVCLPHLWGHNRPGTRQRVANATPGASYNDLMSVTGIDELTGNAIFNGVRVHVSPVSWREPPEKIHNDEGVEEFVAR